MGLKHLKSIFTEGLQVPDKSDVSDFWSGTEHIHSANPTLGYGPDVQGGLFNSKEVPPKASLTDFTLGFSA